MSKFLTAPNENALRNKVGMVLFAIERAVGDDLKAFNPELTTQVAASYFQDLLELSCKVYAETDKGSDYSLLREHVAAYDGCEIRNAVSHPNRGLTDNHWFRVAAIASDPLIEKLQLSAVSEALAAATENQISIPPEHWFLKESRALPNSLPDRSDHDATGFIGRKNDLRKLRNLLENRRLPAVAVVGPGGSGKTAIALSVLNDLAHDTSVRSWCDGILYVSAKKEELTVDGVKPLQADASIRAICESIASIAKDLNCDDHFSSSQVDPSANRLLVVCIDNFETVLAEDEDSMDKLNSLLPPTVKLLLTSRGRVDGATTMPLGNLQEGDATGLATRYAERVAGVELASEILRNIASNLSGSPLAIKLAIDLYARNHNLEEATSKARTDVIGFSFTNLIEKLTEAEVLVVETLFLSEGRSALGDIIGLVDRDRETVIQAITSLSRTSLVLREHADAGDIYSINDNIRSLVRQNSRHLRMRPELQRRMRERAQRILHHQTIQKEKEVNKDDQDYIDDQLPAQLRHILIAAIRILKTRNINKVGFWFGEADQCAAEYVGYAAFHYFYGRMLLLVGDIKAALDALGRAITLHESYIWAHLFLAEALLTSTDIGSGKQAVSQLEGVKNDCQDTQSRLYGRFWFLYYWALESSHDWTKIRNVAASESYKSALRYSNLHLSYAGFSECKIVRNHHGENREQAREGFEAALTWFERLPEAEFLTPRDTKRVLLVFKELAHFLSQDPIDNDPAWVYDRLQSVATVSEALFSKGCLVDDFYEDCLELISELGGHPIGRENPCKHIAWAKHLWASQECSRQQLDAASAKGLTVARVTAKNDVRRFFIAECVTSGQTILCHKDNAPGGGSEFRRLRTKELVVLRSQRDKDGNPKSTWWTRLGTWDELSTSNDTPPAPTTYVP